MMQKLEPRTTAENPLKLGEWTGELQFRFDPLKPRRLYAGTLLKNYYLKNW